MPVEARIAQLGITLSQSPAAIGKFTYVPAKRVGNLVYVSGQLPRRTVADNKLEIVCGRVGHEVSLPSAKEAARLCAVALVSVVKSFIGDLDKHSVSVVRVEGFVNSSPDFKDHPEVMNGCSDLLVEVFGSERGSHTRTAVGCSSLPLGACVEVSAIFEVI